MKDYLTFENDRNRRNRRFYSAMLIAAFGCDHATVIGHHLCWEQEDGSLQEIPSADAMYFDHAIMRAIFGDLCIEIMRDLAGVPCHQRDKRAQEYFRTRHDPEAMRMLLSMAMDVAR